MLVRGYMPNGVPPSSLPVWLCVLTLHYIRRGGSIQNERGAAQVVSHDAELPVVCGLIPCPQAHHLSSQQVVYRVRTVGEEDGY